MTSENGALNQRLELRATGLRKSFGGVEVLHGVDITVKGGEVLALLGENGAGKSTAIKILAGDYKRDAGVIVIDGEEADIRSPRDAGAYGLRVIYQEFSDAPDLTVAENLSLGRLPRNRFGLVDWSRVRRDAREILEKLGIE
ncbi:MAG: ATP-binding cassette domain-containing protein, partial [bacterium]|nr:ATP-binding cassette domain-containing protein [bacterium]